MITNQTANLTSTELLSELISYLGLRSDEYSFWDYKKASNGNKSTIEINHINLVTVTVIDADTASVSFDDMLEDTADKFYFDGTVKGLKTAYKLAYRAGYRVMFM